MTMTPLAAFVETTEHHCPVCLDADHVRPSQCAVVPDDLRVVHGVIALDAAAARQQERVMVRARKAIRRPLGRANVSMLVPVVGDAAPFAPTYVLRAV